jgi:uncharacterized protein YqjF (DUF2071 family)
MHPALRHLDHRPWPVPDRPWVLRQSWQHLLFAHWPVPAAALRRLVPPALEVEEFDGTSWVGVVPFLMRDVMLRGVPAVPGLSAFPELNLRLYVRHGDRPGVWFLSLDAANAPAVWTARTFVFLPYVRARMPVAVGPGGVDYRSYRRWDGPPVHFEATYRPTGPVYHAGPGTLDHWLTERYCLYAQSPRGTLIRVQIHHDQWPLQPAEASIARNDLPSPHGLALPDVPPLLHFARRLDLVTWPPERVAGLRSPDGEGERRTGSEGR